MEKKTPAKKQTTRKPPLSKPTAKKTEPKKTPDLMTVVQKGTGMRARVPASEIPKPAMNAEQIADWLETEAKKLQEAADILRGKK